MRIALTSWPERVILLIPFLWSWSEAVKGKYINREESSCLCVVLSSHERWFLVYECRFVFVSPWDLQTDRGGVDASLESGCVPWFLDMRCVKWRRACEWVVVDARYLKSCLEMGLCCRFEPLQASKAGGWRCIRAAWYPFVSLDATGFVAQSSKPCCVSWRVAGLFSLRGVEEAVVLGVVGLASCLSCLFVITIVCDQERCLLQEAGGHALIRHVWEGCCFGCSGVKGLQLLLIERLEALSGWLLRSRRRGKHESWHQQRVTEIGGGESVEWRLSFWGISIWKVVMRLVRVVSLTVNGDMLSLLWGGMVSGLDRVCGYWDEGMRRTRPELVCEEWVVVGELFIPWDCFTCLLSMRRGLLGREESKWNGWMLMEWVLLNRMEWVGRWFITELGEWVLSRDGRIGWDCMSAVELWGVVFMGGGEWFGNGIENGDNPCWIVLFGVNTMR